MNNPLIRLARERAETEPVPLISDDDLVRVVLGTDTRATAPLSRASPAEISELLDISHARAARLSSAFELGRRGAWSPPARGERCLDPGRVYELLRDVAHEETECFYVVLLDVRGRLLGRRLISRGSLSQCPVSPRDALRPAVREGVQAWSSPTTTRAATQARAPTTSTSLTGSARPRKWSACSPAIM